MEILQNFVAFSEYINFTCSKCDLQSRPSTLTVTLSFGATLSTSIFQASESVVDAKISDGLAISKSDMALPSSEGSIWIFLKRFSFFSEKY